MDFWLTVLVVVRRWYVSIPVFVLALGVAAAVYSTVPTLYTSYGAFVLTTPRTGASLPVYPGTTNAPVNPLLNFDRGLTVAASILTTTLSTGDTARELGIVPNGDTAFKVHNGNPNAEALASGPFLFVEGQSLTPQVAQDIVRTVMARARTELFRSQQYVNAPPVTYITMTELVAPTPPEPQTGRKLRSAVVALALGGMASLFFTYAFDSVAQARRRRREGPVSAQEAAVRVDERLLAAAGTHVNGHLTGEKQA
ncbi:hypothetical protein [Nonomuraea sp. NPDC050643]|uniref:hypothetical protein n=1 Tax=Nonomuraea sp. NPDC050643 TaxID=3155660 RepID=UPI0033F0F589